MQLYHFWRFKKRILGQNNYSKTSPTSPEFAQLGIKFPSSGYFKYVDVSAEQALRILETGLDQIYKDYDKEEVEEYIKLLLKPLLSEGSLKSFKNIRNEISARKSENRSKETKEMNPNNTNIQIESTVSLINMFLIRKHLFQKCLPTIIKVIDPLLMALNTGSFTTDLSTNQYT